MSQDRSDIRFMPLPQLVSMALKMWANYIETGDPVVSGRDLHNMHRQKELRPLSPEQHGAIARLHQVAEDFAAGLPAARESSDCKGPNSVCDDH